MRLLRILLLEIRISNNGIVMSEVLARWRSRCTLIPPFEPQNKVVLRDFILNLLACQGLKFPLALQGLISPVLSLGEYPPTHHHSYFIIKVPSTTSFAAWLIPMYPIRSYKTVFSVPPENGVSSA
jgi:hypothetical protein